MGWRHRLAGLHHGGAGPGGHASSRPAPDEIERIRAKHDFLKPLTVPAGSYPGQDSPIASVGSWSFVLARPTLEDDMAYRLARALHRAEGDLGQKLAQSAGHYRCEYGRGCAQIPHSFIRVSLDICARSAHSVQDQRRCRFAARRPACRTASVSTSIATA